MNSSSAKPYLKIGDVARRVGVSPSVIRSWESLGLTRPRRTESKYRLYTADDVKLLKRARFLRKVRGLNAAAIVELLRREGTSAPSSGRRRRSDWLALAPIAGEAEALPRSGGASGWHLGGISERAGAVADERVGWERCASWRDFIKPTSSIFLTRRERAAGRCSRDKEKCWKLVPAFAWSCWPGEIP